MARLCTLVLAASFAPTLAFGQTIGTFRWQLVPFCNVVTLAVTQNAGVFEVEGTDDQCGASGVQASAIGTAFFNANGTVGIGLNIISTPGGLPVHVDATITVATLGGTWRDSAGNAGNFVFTSGAGTGGSPRPAPTSGIAPGSVGSAHVDASQVQLRVSGTCAGASFMQGVGQSGNVSCAPEVGDISSVTAGAGLTGGGVSGSLALSLQTISSGAFSFANVNGLVSAGTFQQGSIPFSGGPGARMMWYPGKAAFRAGVVFASEWDDANIGAQSVAFGGNTVAVGSHSLAAGNVTVASGVQSVALGFVTTASGPQTFAMGDHAAATAQEAVAMGLRVTAGAEGSVVLGSDAVAIPAATGAIILSDRSTTTDFIGFAPNEFLVRAAGGTGIYSNAALTAGVTLAPGASAWAAISDVNLKENFRDLDGDDVLSKIARMPIREWNYKAQDAAIRHLGPTAQDFHAAFGLGEDPVRISTIDADGVALRAIQALVHEIALLRERIAQLEGRQK